MKLPSCCWLMILVAFFAASPPAAATPRDFSLHGAVKSFNLYLDSGSPEHQEVFSSAQNLRLELSAGVTAALGFEAALDQRLLWRNRPGFMSLPQDNVNRFFDFEQNRREKDRLSGQLQADRLNLHADNGRLSWTLGRQAIGFGRISLFSPLDVIAPFAPDAVDTDTRPGVDALKINRYFGLAGQLGGIVVFGSENRYNSYLLSAGENVRNVDLLLLTGILRDRALLGLGAAGDIGNLGLKAEISLYHGLGAEQSSGDPRREFAVAAMEAWYRLNNGLVVIAEYLYSGFGSNDPAAYPLIADSAPVREGLGFLLGRHYLMLGPSLLIHPLVNLSGLLICNLRDHSFLLQPQLAFSLADNVELDLFWNLTSGHGPRLAGDGPQPVVRSEFGSGGRSGGFFLRWYF